MRFVRQSTAVTVTIGPFLDDTDGKTAETALSITQSLVQLSKNDAAFAQKSDTGTASHKANGYYSVSLNATDTGTVGHLVLTVNATGALPVWQEFTVLEEAVYDALFAASATGALPVASGGITASSFASGAINAAAIAADAIGASELAADAASEIATAVWAATTRVLTAGTNIALAKGTGLTGLNDITATDVWAAATRTLTSGAAPSETTIAAAVLATLKAQDSRGTAQAGASTTITLATSASATDDFYNGAIIILLAGTGTASLTVAQRTRQIVDYVGSTKVATVDQAWATAPASDTVYLVIGG